MPTKHHVLDLLQRDELLEVVDHFEVDVHDRRVKSQLVEAIAAARRPSLGEIPARAMMCTTCRDTIPKQSSPRFAEEESANGNVDRKPPQQAEQQEHP